MLRSLTQRSCRLIIGLNTRSCSSDVAWSTGEKKHPAPPDCTIGRKGEYPKELPDGGLQYFGFRYYPRHTGEQDTPVDPAPLHLVTRIKSLKGRPFWEKDTMKSFGLHKGRGEIAILKNNPENNANLWRVKHLVRVTPIKLPENFPENADPRHCFLKENGELSYSTHIGVDEKELIEDEEIAKTKMSIQYLEKHTRKNWENPWHIKPC